MTMRIVDDDHPAHANPVLWLSWVLLAGCVLAGFTTLAVAIRSADRALPVAYHWEGAQLDADFARARHAADVGIVVKLELLAGGACRAFLEGAPSVPPAIRAQFTNGTDPALDRVARLAHTEHNEFRGDCGALATGRWHIAIEDDARQWSLRARIVAPRTQIELRGRRPEGIS
jgi:hypothetical protein